MLRGLSTRVRVQDLLGTPKAAGVDRRSSTESSSHADLQQRGSSLDTCRKHEVRDGAQPFPKTLLRGGGGGHKPHQRNAPAGKLRHGDVRPDREPLAGRAFPFAPRFLLRTPRCRRRFNYTELNATQDGAGWGGGTCSWIPFQKLTEQKKKKKKKSGSTQRRQTTARVYYSARSSSSPAPWVRTPACCQPPATARRRARARRWQGAACSCLLAPLLDFVSLA